MYVAIWKWLQGTNVNNLVMYSKKERKRIRSVMIEVIIS